MYDDDDDDIEPEWNSFDPEKETGSFFGREIPDEKQIRSKFAKKEIEVGDVDEIEDAFDELVFEEMEKDQDYQMQKKKEQQRLIDE